MFGIELGEVEALLARVQTVVSQEDYARLAGLVEMLIEVTRELHKQGARLARLRRLIGLRNTEKTAAVLGNETSAEEDTSGTEPTAAGGPDGEATKGTQHERKKKGHGRRPASAYDAHHIDVPHPHLHPGSGCPECARGRLHRLHDPALYLRIFGQAPLFAICWDCERLRCSACGHVFMADPPEEAQGPKYAESAVSMMTLLRYGLGLPLHRLGRLQENLGVPISASTQWEVARDHASALVPVYEELVDRAANGTVIHNDDTYVRILEFMGKRRARLLAAGQLPDPDRTGLFTTAIVSLTDSGPVAVFSTGRQHAGENLRDVLEKRSPELGPPIHMCDGLDRNRPPGHPVLESNCLAHGRRHVVDEAESFPPECRHILEQLGIVFRNEESCRKKGWKGETRLLFHQEESGPVMDSLAAWMKEQFEKKRIEPNSGLGRAIGYLRRRWEKLTLFLRVPDAPLENNLCERVLKMAIRHRRNSLFYRSAKGAGVGDLYMTLIHTAQLQGENPFAYLTALLIHRKQVVASPGDWLPWTYRGSLEPPGRGRAA